MLSSGDKLNRLTIVSNPFKIEGNRRYFVDVVCDCGVFKTVREYAVRVGSIKSCGCLRDENTSNLNRTHSMYGTGSYISWNLMKDRCNNMNNKSYNDYGGRGISYDPRWESFEEFYKDMGDRPEGLTLDRIDVNGDYCKDNCRWDSRSTQTHNIRKKENIGGNKTTSKYFGVAFCTLTKKWIARLVYNKTVVLFERFSSEILAAIAYDNYSSITYGDRPNKQLLKGKTLCLK